MHEMKMRVSQGDVQVRRSLGLYREAPKHQAYSSWEKKAPSQQCSHQLHPKSLSPTRLPASLLGNPKTYRL